MTDGTRPCVRLSKMGSFFVGGTGCGHRPWRSGVGPPRIEKVGPASGQWSSQRRRARGATGFARRPGAPQTARAGTRPWPMAGPWAT